MVNVWLRRITILYGIWFVCGLALVTRNMVPSWLVWTYSFYLILGGITAFMWYVDRYGLRQGLILIAVCGSLPYAAQWMGTYIEPWFGGYDYSEYHPIVLNVPLTLPFAWCMLLVLSRTFAPIRNQDNPWRGLRLSEKLSPELERLKRERRRSKLQSFWIPTVWAASMVAGIHVLLDPLSAQKQAWNPAGFHFAIGSSVYWWIIALFIVNIINYLHDEYFQKYSVARSRGNGLSIMLLLTLELLLLTFALKNGLWLAVSSNIAVIAVLLLWKRKIESGS